MKKHKKTVKLKTIKIISHNNFKNVFDIMTSISKNIYNCCVFTNNIFYIYQNIVYKEIYDYLFDNTNSKLTNEQKQYINDKNYMPLIISIFKGYYDMYSNNFQLMKDNNDLIYKHIKDKINKDNIILNNLNINTIRKTVIDELKYINYTLENKQIVFDDIIDRIIRSFYDKKYFLTRYQMLNHIKFTFNDEILIENIKNNEYYYDEKNISYKTKILKELNIKLKSNQYIFKKFVYENSLNNNADKLPADIILNIIDKYHEMITSYYGLLNRKIKANKPKYLHKNDKFNLFYYPSSFKLFDEKVRLTLGKHTAENIISNNNKITKINNRKYCYTNMIIDNKKFKHEKNKENYVKIKNGYINKRQIIDAYYINITLPKTLHNKNIKLIQIKPYGNKYFIYFTYETTQNMQQTKHKITTKNSISIDTGIKNLMTIYDPIGEQHIIKGSNIKSINEFYNKKIAGLQSYNKTKLDKNTFNRKYSLLIERKNKLDGEINRIIDLLLNTYMNKENIIIGYNEGWKTKVNLGSHTNRNFYSIPYSRIIYKLKEKLESNGKNLIIHEESYTSKCDSLTLENLTKRDNFNGDRIYRGLFISKIGKAINADLNGAINIMRKVINIKKITGEKIYNPTVIRA